MNRDDILLAFRLIAMGRAGHPLQEQLADELVKVFARECKCQAVEFPTAADPTEETAVESPKRTRKAKAH